MAPSADEIVITAEPSVPVANGEDPDAQVLLSFADVSVMRITAGLPDVHLNVAFVASAGA